MGRALEGKRIIVAGGAGGILSEWCLYFAEQGAKVLVSDVGYLQSEALGGDYDLATSSRGPADSVVRRIRDAGGTAEADCENAAEVAGAKRTVEHCLDVFGGVDILLCGTCVSKLGECKDLSPEDFDAVIKNVLYPDYNLTKCVLPHMIGQQWGRLLYTNSVVIRSFWGSANYAAAFGGVYSFMRCIANEVRPDGITANCVEPTAVGKTGARPGGAAFLDRRARALGLVAVPAPQVVAAALPARSIAPLVTYLFTDQAGGITGQNFAARGNRYALYGTFEEKDCIDKDPALGEWAVEEIGEVMPATLEKQLVKLWYPREDQQLNAKTPHR